MRKRGASFQGTYRYGSINSLQDKVNGNVYCSNICFVHMMEWKDVMHSVYSTLHNVVGKTLGVFHALHTHHGHCGCMPQGSCL